MGKTKPVRIAPKPRTTDTEVYHPGAYRDFLVHAIPKDAASPADWEQQIVSAQNEQHAVNLFKFRTRDHHRFAMITARPHTPEPDVAIPATQPWGRYTVTGVTHDGQTETVDLPARDEEHAQQRFQNRKGRSNLGYSSVTAVAQQTQRNSTWGDHPSAGVGPDISGRPVPTQPRRR